MSGAFICVALIAFPVPKSGTPAPPVEMLIRLTVQPMAAPRPALRYQLLPEMRELQPGNPIPGYLKSLLDQDQTIRESNLGPSALRQADRAARLDKPDWQILDKLKIDGISLLVPDLQKMRELAAGLQARFREEIAQRRFDDAIATAKTMLALSRHVGEHPTLIGDLVAIAIAMITISPLEELLEQPGCPNLYWALTNLPYPLIAIDKGLDGERVMMQAELRDLSDTEPMTAEQIKKVMDHIEYFRKFEADTIRQTARQWVSVRTRDAKYLAAARLRLIEAGIAEERVAIFPVDQVILLDEKREYEVRRDDLSKLAKLPTWEYEAFTRKLVKPTEPAFFDFMIAAFQKVRRAQGRLEQKIALLRHVEALRMYAAEHDGKLPEKLADIDLPLPVDPFSGKAFRYAKDGDTAHLRGNPPIGEEKIPTYNLHYEITIRK